MARLRIGGHSLQLDLNPARLARQYEGLQRIRQQMIHNSDGNSTLVDQYLMKRLTGAIEHFGSRYAQEMSQRLENIFTLRDRVSGVYQGVLQGKHVTPDQLRTLFRQLNEEMGNLHSPIDKANSLTTLDPGPRPARVVESSQGSRSTDAPPRTDSTPNGTTDSLRSATDIDTHRSLTTLEQALGQGHLTGSQRQRLRAQLDSIHPRLLRTLEGSADAVRRSATRLFSQHFQGWSRWNIEAIRGVLKAFDPVRGIPHSALYRMFQNWNSSSLNRIFLAYHRIADMPGANHIFSDNFTPLQSSLMVDIYSSISRLRLPENMSSRAVLGLFNLYRQGKDVHAEILNTLPDRRLQMLEDASPLSQSLRKVSDSLTHLPAQLQASMARLSQPIRHGINLLDGSADSIVKAIESHAQAMQHPGRFGDAAVRSEFTTLVGRFKKLYENIVNNGDKNNAKLRNLVGLHEEINRSIQALEMGGDLHTVGNINRVTIQPDLYPLTGGIHVKDAPKTQDIQFDHLVTTIHGRLRAVETTTGKLGLPDAWKVLDPKSGRTGTTISWADLSDSASHRKWKQIIKLWQAATFAHQLGEAWGGTSLQMPELVVRAGSFTEPARRALIALDFRLEISGGPATPSATLSTGATTP